MVASLYPAALDCGIPPDTFWGLSVGEVCDLLESHERERKRRAKQTVNYVHELAGLIGLYMQGLFEAGVQIPYPWDHYPELFEEERYRYERQHQAEMVEKARASRKEYARRYNEMRRKMGLE